MLDPEYRNQFKRKAAQVEEAKQKEKKQKESFETSTNKLFETLVSSLIETMENIGGDLAALSPTARVKAVIDLLDLLLPYVRPKLNPATPKANNDADSDDYMTRLAGLAKNFAASQ